MRKQILKFLPNLRRFAYSLSGNADDADDLVQSTVERLLTKKPPKDVHLLKWSIRVCRNIWIDEVRKRNVRQAININDMEQEIMSQDGETLALNRITLDQISTVMDSLPEQQRSVLAMVSVGCLSYAEISNILDIPIGTVMSRVSRARKNLSISFSAENFNKSSTTFYKDINHELH